MIQNSVSTFFLHISIEEINVLTKLNQQKSFWSAYSWIMNSKNEKITRKSNEAVRNPYVDEERLI